MSNEPSKSEDKSTDRSNPPSRAKSLDGEGDLWDLDDELESDFEKNREKSEKTVLPSRRAAKDPLISTRKPAEHNVETDVPEDPVPEGLPDLPYTEPSEEEKQEIPPLPEEPRGDKEEIPEESETPPLESDRTETVEEEPAQAETTAVEPPSERVRSPFSLSLIEKLCILVLFAILSAAAIYSIVHFSNQIELKPLIGDDLDLPVEGKMATVTSVTTFWREPITTGDDRDIVKRDVELIPVIELDLESNSSTSGALRFLFKNDQGELVGDNITRRIPSSGSLKVAATDGFNDLGMHAAYRTGNSDRWIVEVLEGPSVGAPIEEFKLLFETEISTKMR